MTLEESDFWLGTRTGAGGTATLGYSLLVAVHASMENRTFFMKYLSWTYSKIVVGYDIYKKYKRIPIK